MTAMRPTSMTLRTRLWAALLLAPGVGIGLLTATLAGVSTLTGCGDDDGATAGDGGNDAGDDGNGADETTPAAALRKQVLADVTANVITPTYDDFAKAAGALSTALTALRAQPADAAAREAAKAAYKTALLKFARVDTLQVGPLGNSSTRIGGQDIRDTLHAFPTLNTCRIDQAVVSGDYDSSTFFSTALVNVTGLGAIEYLLYNDAAANSCPPQANINAQGTWAALGANDLAARRTAYAAVLAARVKQQADKLVSAWASFAPQFKAPGQNGSIYASSQQAVDQLFAALYYGESVVKDLKLAVPTGLSPACTAATCPAQQESPWANLSREALLENLKALRALYTGGADTAKGFDDLLVQAGATDLSKKILTDMDAAIALVEGESRTFTELLASDLPKAEAFYNAVKTYCDDLKSQFVTVLNLSVPNEGAGDND